MLLKEYLTEHTAVKGFFKHPYFPHIFLSRDGSVYNDLTQSFMEFRVSKGYLNISRLGTSVHRLMCETFLEIPAHLKDGKVVVNHLNGIPSDNRLENLEWTTYKGNADHAYRTGLRKDNTPVHVKDLRSGEVVKHYSLQGAARAHGVNGACIHWFLKSENFGKVFRKFFVVIREGSEWPSTDQSAMNPKGSGYEREVYVEDYRENKKLVFKNLYHAAEHLEMQMATIYARLRKVASKGLNGYVTENYAVWYLDTYLNEIPKDARWVMGKAKRFNTKPVRKPVPILVTDLSTGETETVSSSEVFARRLGVTKNTFQRNIYFHDGVWKGKYRVQYLDRDYSLAAQ